MKRKVISALTALCLAALPLSQALAHGGGLDRHGCHRETATGGYHCHRGGDDDKEDIDWALIGGVVGGLVALVIAIRWLQDDKASLIQIVPHAYDENRLGIAAEYSLGPAGAVGLHATTPIGEDRENTRTGAYWKLRF